MLQNVFDIEYSYWLFVWRLWRLLLIGPCLSRQLRMPACLVYMERMVNMPSYLSALALLLEPYLYMLLTTSWQRWYFRLGLLCFFCSFDSAPSLGVYYLLSLTLSVHMSVCLSRSLKLILLLCFSIESSHFLAVISPCGILQNFFFDFWFRPPNTRNLLPKICTKSPISWLVWQIDRRCLGLLGGFRGWPLQWNHAKCCGAAHCCHGNRIWPRRGDLNAYRLVSVTVCVSDSFVSNYWPSPIWYCAHRKLLVWNFGSLFQKRLLWFRTQKLQFDFHAVWCKFTASVPIFRCC